MRNRQAEAVNKLSDRELLLNVYLTQCMLLLLSIILGIILFGEFWFLTDMI
ncbi:MAG: hypothetical protein WBV93_06865 [Anaerobacillus sp.]